MKDRDWEVAIRRKSDDAEIEVLRVVAPTWLAAETIAATRAAARHGGRDDDYRTATDRAAAARSASPLVPAPSSS